MRLYKLTNADGCTKDNTQWEVGITHSAKGSQDQDLCSDGFIHAYESPLLAVLLNPIHADFDPLRLWEAEGEIIKRDGQLKVGCKSLTTIREIPIPAISTEQRVRFAILVSKTVYLENSWSVWATNWLNGKDRTKNAARAAAWAAYATNAANAAAYAVYAANAATAAAYAAYATNAAEAAVDAANAAAYATTAATAASHFYSKELDLISIAEQAIGEES